MKSTTAVGSAIIAAVSALGVVTVAGPQAQEMPRWEYKVARGPGISISASADEIAAGMAHAEGTLNGLGQEGWELVDYESPYAIFRRPAMNRGRR